VTCPASRCNSRGGGHSMHSRPGWRDRRSFTLQKGHSCQLRSTAGMNLPVAWQMRMTSRLPCECHGRVPACHVAVIAEDISATQEDFDRSAPGWIPFAKTRRVTRPSDHGGARASASVGGRAWKNSPVSLRSQSRSCCCRCCRSDRQLVRPLRSHCRCPRHHCRRLHRSVG